VEKPAFRLGADPDVLEPVHGMPNPWHSHGWVTANCPRLFISHSQILQFVLHHSHATNLHRFYGSGYSHFITSSCYQRRPLLATPCARDLFLEVMEQIRQRHQFVVSGYVVMPEHVHLLFTEHERGNPSLVLAALKQTFARRLRRELRAESHTQTDSLWSTPVTMGHIWQRGFYDFVIFTEKKRVEKLRYMHRNPVQRGLVLEPEEWLWSSFRHYAYGEPGPALVNETQKAELHIRKIS
jgi:putative transposase